jgi:hypothetical protein
VISTGKQLLTDIKYVFDQEEGEDKLTTRSIIVELVEIEGGPWALMFEDAVKFDRMKSAASKLAKLLRPYKIEPRTIKLASGSTAKGYHRADFEEAWQRHLTIPGVTEVPNQSVTPEANVTENTREGYEVTTVTSSRDTSGPESGAESNTPSAHKLLIDLVARVDTQAKLGLHPKGHPDCPWHERYPAEYRAAKNYVVRRKYDEKQALERLARLVRKIEAAALRGTPLEQANAREWDEGSYPAAFLAARDFIQKQAEKEAEELGPIVIVYPGDWLTHSPTYPLPDWAKVDPNAQCELCGEEVDKGEQWFIQRTEPSRARCADCQSVIWQVEGREVSWPGGIAIPGRTEEKEEQYLQKPDLKQDARRLVESVVDVLGEAYVPTRAKELLE